MKTYNGTLRIALPCHPVYRLLFHSPAGSTHFFDCIAWRQVFLSMGSTLSIPQRTMSFCTVSRHVFFGRPHEGMPSTCMVVTLFIQSGLRVTCPYHLSLLPCTRVSIGARLSLVSREVDDFLSSKRTLHIHLIMVLSVLCMRSMSFFVVAQHSAAWSKTLRTQELKR